MGKTVSVGTLRQNPTQILREVRAGAHYTVIDHGYPVADVVPPQNVRWVPIEDVDALLGELGPDIEWAREIDEDRLAGDGEGPWDGAT